MEKRERFSSPALEIVSAAFGRAVGELAVVFGAEGEVGAVLRYAAEVARETILACREAEGGRDAR